MNQKQIEEYCLSKKGVEFDYKIEWEATRGQIHNKMFILIGGDKEKREIVSLKCEPMMAEIYRTEYKDVIPGYYLNKVHWNSIYMDGEVPDNVLKEMIDMSYNLVLQSLPKKIKEQYIYRIKL